jgi:hypothetical protein
LKQRFEPWMSVAKKIVRSSFEPGLSLNIDLR